MKFTRTQLWALALCLSAFFLPLHAEAGGPRYVGLDGTFSHWDTEDTAVVYTESGSCGAYTNTDMRDLVSQALAVWQEAGSSDASLQMGSSLNIDINSDNYADYFIDGKHYNPNSINLTGPQVLIIFDNDGAITADLMGEDAEFTYVGLSSLNSFGDANLSEIAFGQMILNCRCLNDHPLFTDSACYNDVSAGKFASTIVHEVGHLFNLDHSVAGEESFQPFGWNNVSLTATMYPYVTNRSDPFAISTDDAVALGSIAPSPTFLKTHCQVTGRLLDSSGGELACANVVATTDDAADTVSFITGALSPNLEFDDHGVPQSLSDCESDCGDFELYLEVGKAYSLAVASIDSDFVGAASVGPCRNEQPENISAETDLVTIAADTCQAGAVIALGDVNTQSDPATTTFLPTSASGSQSEDAKDSDADNLSQDTSSPAAACSLLVSAATPSPLVLGWFLIVLATLAGLRFHNAKNPD